mgnify:CR=1 FL=1
MRLIDADQLEKQFENLAESWRGTLSGPVYANALNRVKRAPTIDAAPVVHGRWDEKEVINGGTILICSACKYPFRRLEPKNYCPNCGTKMVLEVAEI